MPITFTNIEVGVPYSRQTLASLWSYKSFHAIARGVVTPRGDDKILLFVTEDKQASAEQYADRLIGNVLEWEGPRDHFAEDRMVATTTNAEEIHLFHRATHHSDFVYLGQITVKEFTTKTDSPSHFKFTLAVASSNTPSAAMVSSASEGAITT